LFFSVNDYFLTNKALMNADINYCIQCPENIENSLSEFHTLLIDLSQSPEAIQKNMYHRTVSEINSFLTNQQYDHKILYTISSADLDDFMALFDTFAKAKRIRKAERFRLKAYNDQGILAISFLKQKEEFLYINFYRLTRERASNIYSFSPYDPTNKILNKTQLGRAHRALHWLDIIEFKGSGVNYYDFCGWYNGNSDKHLLNINAFKEQFSQTKVIEYSGVIYKNKFLVRILKFFR
jgi:hypothetical protein